MHKKMNHSKEWHWNFNVHRDHSSLANVSACAGTHLPKISSCYTNAVITNVGLCVGMRNVNLNAESHACAGDLFKMPNCCSNLNVVGQHNEQIWAIARDRMKFSTLTDSLMTIRSAAPINNLGMGSIYGYPHLPQHPYHHPSDWLPNACCNVNTNKILNTGSNPFHLFGDRSNLSRTQHANTITSSAPCYDYSKLPTECIDVITMPMNGGQTYHANNNLNIAGHDNHSLNGRHFNDEYWLTVYGPSFPYSTPSFESTANDSNPCGEQDNDNMSRIYHVAAPKKKWIQNYMQSNSTYCFCSLLFFFYTRMVWFCCFHIVCFCLIHIRIRKAESLSSSALPTMSIRHTSKLEFAA